MTYEEKLLDIVYFVENLIPFGVGDKKPKCDFKYEKNPAQNIYYFHLKITVGKEIAIEHKMQYKAVDDLTDKEDAFFAFYKEVMLLLIFRKHN